MKKTFFCDFDGTITDRDTCLLLMETFCSDGWQEFDQQWVRKEITSAECAQKIFHLITAPPAEIQAMLAQVKIDPSFLPFLENLERKGHEIYILSDGYDFLMDSVLEKHGLLRLVRYVNRMRVDRLPYRLECPHHNPSCGQCGVCKKSLIQSLRRPDRQTVYIGDGYSDTCACQGTDVLFAKNDLYRFCQDKSIAAIPFQSFAEISRWLEKSDDDLSSAMPGDKMAQP